MSPLRTRWSVSPGRVSVSGSPRCMLVDCELAHSNGFTILCLYWQSDIVFLFVCLFVACFSNRNLAPQYGISFSEAFTPFMLSPLSCAAPQDAEERTLASPSRQPLPDSAELSWDTWPVFGVGLGAIRFTTFPSPCPEPSHCLRDHPCSKNE